MPVLNVSTKIEETHMRVKQLVLAFFALLIPVLSLGESIEISANPGMRELCSKADSRRYQSTIEITKPHPDEPFRSIEKGAGYVKIRKMVDKRDLDKPGRGDIPALTYAAFMGNWQAAHALIDLGADVNLAKTKRSSPLEYAVTAGRLDIACKLIESGALLPKDATDQADLFKGVANPLYTKHPDDAAVFAKFLISKGFDVNAPNSGNWTLLMGAASQGNKLLAGVLISNGADISVVNKINGRTALEEARINGHQEIVEIIQNPPRERN